MTKKAKVVFNGQKYTIDYIEDWGMKCGQNWLFCNKYGPSILVNVADNVGFDSVHEAILDHLPSIEHEELYQAYGFDSEIQYDSFCLLAEEDSDIEWPDLQEGYYSQPNSGGSTGIVYLGYYWTLDKLSKGKG